MNMVSMAQVVEQKTGNPKVQSSNLNLNILKLCVFGPPGSGSGSTSQRNGSGSGSFYHQAKIVRKTLISTIL